MGDDGSGLLGAGKVAAQIEEDTREALPLSDEVGVALYEHEVGDGLRGHLLLVLTAHDHLDALVDIGGEVGAQHTAHTVRV